MMEVPVCLCFSSIQSLDASSKIDERKLRKRPSADPSIMFDLALLALFSIKDLGHRFVGPWSFTQSFSISKPITYYVEFMKTSISSDGNFTMLIN